MALKKSLKTENVPVGWHKSPRCDEMQAYRTEATGKGLLTRWKLLDRSQLDKDCYYDQAGTKYEICGYFSVKCVRIFGPQYRLESVGNSALW